MKQQMKRSIYGIAFSFVMALTIVVTTMVTEVHAASISGPLYKIKDDGSDYDRETEVGTVYVEMTNSGRGSVTGIADGAYGGCTMDDINPIKEDMTIDDGYTKLVVYGINLAASGYSDQEEISGIVKIPVPTGYDAASAKIWKDDSEEYTSTGITDNGDGTISINASGTASAAYGAGFGFYIEYKTKSANPPAGNGSTKPVVIEATGDVTSTISSSDNIIPSTAVFKSTKVESGTKFENAKKLIEASQGKVLKDFRVIEFDLLNGETAINELGGYVEVSLDVPQGISATDGFAFKVYRLDDNKLVACDTKYENGKISFKTNHFSTYIIAQEAIELKPTDQDSPKTGENTIYYLAIVLMMLAAFSITVIYAKRMPRR